MTLLTAPSVPTSTADERAARLTEAGAAWGDRIAADATSAQLTYRVAGVGEGSVATTIRAGKHAIVVDEPADLGVRVVQRLGDPVEQRRVTRRGRWGHVEDAQLGDGGARGAAQRARGGGRGAHAGLGRERCSGARC